MPIPADCSSCNAKLKFPDQYAGRKVRCPKCEGVIALPGESAKADTKKPAPAKPSSVQKKKAAPASKSSTSTTRPDDFDFGSASSSGSKKRSSARDDYDDRDDRRSRDYDDDDYDDYDDRRSRDYDDDYDDYDDDDGLRRHPRELRSVLLPEHLEERVEDELLQGETVIWVGQPSVKLVMIRTVIASVFGMVLAGGGLSFSLFEWGGRLSATGGDGLGAMLIVGGVLFLLGGLGIPALWGRFRAKRTCYVLTDRRAIIWESRWYGGTRVRSYDSRDLHNLKRQDTWWMNNAGDVVFEEQRETMKTSRGRVKTRVIKHGFMSLEMARDVERLIHDVISQRGSPPRPIPPLHPDEEVMHESVSGKTFAIAGTGIALVVAALGFGIYWTISSAQEEVEDAFASRPTRKESDKNDDDRRGDRDDRRRDDDRRAKQLPVGNVNEALAALRAGDSGNQARALDYLARARFDPRQQAAVATGINPLLTSPDRSLESKAFDAANVWATKESVPALLGALDPNGRTYNNPQRVALRVLARFKEPKAIQPIAAYLPNRAATNDAATALSAFGEDAVPVLLKDLHHPDRATHDAVRRTMRPLKVSSAKLIGQTIQDVESTDPKRQHAALSWLATQPVDENERGKVAAKLNSVLKSSDRNVKIAALNATKVWGTKENVPGLISFLDPKAGGIPNDQQKAVLVALGSLKDPRGVKPVANYLTNFFVQGIAEKAIEEMGDVAVPLMLSRMNDPDDKKHAAARKMLARLKVDQDAMLAQTVKDLASDDGKRREHAMLWLSKQKVDKANAEQVTAAVRAIESLLMDESGAVSSAAMQFIELHGDEKSAKAVTSFFASLKVGAFINEREKSAMRFLAKHGDELAAHALIAWFTSSFGHKDAVAALILMNERAEPALLKTILATNDRGILTHVCTILKLTGTTKVYELGKDLKGNDIKANSVKMLEVLYKNHKDRGVKAAAAAAHQIIKAREANKPKPRDKDG